MSNTKRKKRPGFLSKRLSTAKSFDDISPSTEKKTDKKRKQTTTDKIKFPCTPELILDLHHRQPFLNSSEEWLMVELDEHECLLENMKIIKIIGKHSAFFEVEPDELWEEFFEFVGDVPDYDEVINYDIWQEFRDKKYPM